VSVDVTETAAASGSLGGLFGFVYAGSYRHPPADLQVYDADFLSVGVGTNFRFGEKSTGSVVVLAGGDNDRGGNPGGDRRGLGIRLSGERVMGSGFKVLGVAGALNSRYDGFDPAFLAYRKDRQFYLDVVVRYELSPKLELRLGALRSVQDSNIPIYEYRRTDWMLGLRRDFD
jgi:hypothetical protein